MSEDLVTVTWEVVPLIIGMLFIFAIYKFRGKIKKFWEKLDNGEESE